MYLKLRNEVNAINFLIKKKSHLLSKHGIHQSTHCMLDGICGQYPHALGLYILYMYYAIIYTYTRIQQAMKRDMKQNEYRHLV
jgi:hypothetical protein